MLEALRVELFVPTSLKIPKTSGFSKSMTFLLLNGDRLTNFLSISMLHLGKRLHFTSDSAAKAMQHESCALSSAHFVEIGGSSTPTANSLHISVIHAF